MTSMGRMPSRREWEAVVGCMIPSTYSSHSLVVEALLEKGFQVWSFVEVCWLSRFWLQGPRQLGPRMIQQMQHPCNECKGSGETISDKDRCPQCKGDKVVPEKKVLEVVVEKGMQNEQKITFPGEADEAVMTP
uniref:CR-type domain-containing protein n=1 Tax=Zea mays TaxID=4577 RepID=A0A804MGG1_MAIZE